MTASSMFDEIRAAFEDGRRRYEEVLSSVDGGELRDFRVSEQYGAAEENRIAVGDNLRYMAYLLRKGDLKGKIQLIYVDPPFFSNSKYEASLRLHSPKLGASKLLKVGAYDDRKRAGLAEYLTMLTARFFMMKDLLSDTGCLWVHLDWHVAHYVKVLLDSIFGGEHFINEVIWTYKSGGSSRKSFARKHDNLLVYAGGEKYKFRPLKEKSYNREMKPYRFKGVEEFQDERGWFTMVNMKDVWSIDMVGRTSSERNGYATQKPEKLLQRIVGSCSDEGDICADFFAGSGTLGAVCEKMGRKWIMCDESRLAAASQIERMGNLIDGDGFAVESECREEGAGEVSGKPEISAKVNGGLTTVELDAYRPPAARPKAAENGIWGDDEARAEAERYLADDSLSLVKCWSVDWDFDGRVHRADELLSGRERSCRKICDEEKSGAAFTDGGSAAGDRGTAERAVSVVGYDVFGGRFELAVKK